MSEPQESEMAWAVDRVRSAIHDAETRTRLSNYKTEDLGVAAKPPKKVEITQAEARRLLANIRLIAAAPELLEIARGLVAWDEQDDAPLEPFIEKARAVIAKAEGATP